MSPYLLCTATVIAAGAAACAFSLALSSHGFSGYDVSPMIDAGWRVYSGQVPGRDFVVTFPAALYLLTALAFRLFGVTWHAIALMSCWSYAAFLLLGIRLAALVRAHIGEQEAAWTLSAYAVGQTLLLVSINYLWHSSLAESFGVYAVFAAYAAVSFSSDGGGRPIWEALLHLSLGCGCLLLSKPNTGYPVVLLCLWTLHRAGVSRRRVAGVLGLAAVLATLALARVHVTPWGMVGAYAGLTGRLIPKPLVLGLLYAFDARIGLANLLTYALVAPAITAVCVWLWRDRPRLSTQPNLLLAVGAILISLLGMGTNFDFKLTDTPLALFGLALLSLQAIPTLHPLRLRTVIAGGALLLLALYFGRIRLRMQNVGTWADEKCPGRAAFEDSFFGHFTACPIVPATLAEVDRTLAASPRAHIFFGPSLEFLYAARHLPSPLHLPNWWDPGSSYALRETDAVTQAWQDDRFDLLIFNREEDLAQLPAHVRQDLYEQYALVPGNLYTHVYRRR